MTNSRLLTFCIPAYNAASTIEKTLLSLLSQNYAPIKIKIFNNASTDTTIEICQKLASQNQNIEIITSNNTVVAEDNFTKCIQGAEGEYCCIAHTDDIYDPEFAHKAIELLEKDSTAVATFCHAFEIDASEQIIGTRFFPNELSSSESQSLDHNTFHELIYNYGNFVTCPSVVFRSEVLKNQIKIWDGAHFKTSADLDVWIRLSQIGNLIAINMPLIKYRVAEASYSFRIAKRRITKHDIFLVLEKYKDTNVLDKLNFLLLKDQAIRRLNMMRNHIRNQDFPAEVSFDFTLLLKKLFRSKWHFKYSLSIIGIYFISELLHLIGWNKDE